MDKDTKRPTTNLVRGSKQRLTRKQKAFADKLLSDPKKSQRQAYIEVADVGANTKIGSIDSSASRMFRSGPVQSYLGKYSELAEETIVNTIKDYKDSEKLGERMLAVNSSQWVHDKIHGKAKQKIEQETHHYSFSIDLTGAIGESTEVELDK